MGNEENGEIKEYMQVSILGHFINFRIRNSLQIVFNNQLYLPEPSKHIIKFIERYFYFNMK